MKKIITSAICLYSLSLPVYSESTPDGQPILYCPNSVKCDFKLYGTERCRVMDNPSEVWGGYTFSGPKLLEGIYKFKRVEVSAEKRPVCKYYLNDKQPAPLDISLNDPNSNYPTTTTRYINKFNPFLAEGTSWTGTNFGMSCSSNDPKHCPLTEEPEITVTSNGSKSFDMVFYFASGNDSEWEPKFKSSSILSYNELYDLCGSTSECIIDIGESSACRDGFDCLQLGTVSLDLSNPNVVKINKTTSSIPYLSIMQKKPFNTLYSELK
ncbi:TPA: hypothetical protein P5J54_002061 [Legionella pneumophila]|nr:hypothetical protein [Legionella pneumophila]HDP0021104.1 hypothetical protein [Legionella pneumophila]HDP0026539.1 hypothetical protein [Legionella pneumophila]HDP0067204.1 hypothetical protein [Legionella pneumophila]